MEVRVVATWKVLVGLAPPPIDPNEPWTLGQPEYHRRWTYTSNDYEADMKLVKTAPPEEEVQTKFKQMDMEAEAYAHAQRNPAYTNYVRLEWLWY